MKGKGHFCGQACTSRAEKSAPGLLEVPQGHDTFKSGEWHSHINASDR